MPGRKMTNKANGPRRPAGGWRAIAPNKANFPLAESAGLQPGATAPNKANFRPAGPRTGICGAKRTQFRGRGRSGRGGGPAWRKCVNLVPTRRMMPESPCWRNRRATDARSQLLASARIREVVLRPQASAMVLPRRGRDHRQAALDAATRGAKEPDGDDCHSRAGGNPGVAVCSPGPCLHRDNGKPSQHRCLAFQISMGVR